MVSAFAKTAAIESRGVPFEIILKWLRAV
jgi:hypothetical protein